MSSRVCVPSVLSVPFVSYACAVVVAFFLLVVVVGIPQVVDSSFVAVCCGWCVENKKGGDGGVGGGR